THRAWPSIPRFLVKASAALTSSGSTGANNEVILVLPVEGRVLHWELHCVQLFQLFFKLPLPLLMMCCPCQLIINHGGSRSSYDRSGLVSIEAGFLDRGTL